MPNNQKGIIRYFFIPILILIGVLLWFFFQERAKNHFMKAVNLDNKQTEILLSNGIDDSNILSQKRVEHKSGLKTWIEYNKEIKLPGKTDFQKLRTQTMSLAGESGLEFYEVNDNPKSVTFEIKQKDKIFSKINFVKFQGAPLPSGQNKQTSKLKKVVAIVIDDVGNKEDLSEFLNLGVPVNFAVMPGERHSKDIVKKLLSLKIPFIMHIPMEPERYPKVDPGKLALLLKMNGDEITKIFKKDLNSLKGVTGVSNHMGSAFTANYEKMKLFLGLVKNEGLFFLDSNTSIHSQAKKVADELGMVILRNDVFIDNQDDAVYMSKQLDSVIAKAQKHGRCIAIGHIQRKNIIPVLKEYLQKFKDNNIEFVYLKDIINS